MFAVQNRSVRALLNLRARGKLCVPYLSRTRGKDCSDSSLFYHHKFVGQRNREHWLKVRAREKLCMQNASKARGKDCSTSPSHVGN